MSESVQGQQPMEGEKNNNGQETSLALTNLLHNENTTKDTMMDSAISSAASHKDIGGRNRKSRVLWGEQELVLERTERTVVFADAVIAIALTLLILPIMEDASEEHASIAAWYTENGNKIQAFVVSFLVVFRFWMAHADVFLIVKGMTRWMNSFHFLWLLSVVYMPVAVSSVFNVQEEESEESDATSPRQYAELSYCLAALISRLFWLVTVSLARMSPQLWNQNYVESPHLLTECVLNASFDMFYLAIACGLVFVDGVGLRGLFLLLLSDPTVSVIMKFVLKEESSSRSNHCNHDYS